MSETINQFMRLMDDIALSKKLTKENEELRAKVKRLSETLCVCRANLLTLYKAGKDHGSSFGEEFSHDAKYCIDIIDKEDAQ